MEKNPIEQQQSVATNAIKEGLIVELGRNFDNKQELDDRIDHFVFKMDLMQENGLVFDKEEIIRELKECSNIKDKEVFVSRLLKVLEPIIAVMVTNPDIFEKVQREVVLSNPRYVKLSEALHFGLDGEEAQLHLAPATELIKDAGIGNFKNEVVSGLRNLAEFVKSHDSIKEITATSWIVAKNPALLERLGFTIVGEIPKEKKESMYPDEKRPIESAVMSREDFLARYGNE